MVQINKASVIAAAKDLMSDERSYLHTGGYVTSLRGVKDGDLLAGNMYSAGCMAFMPQACATAEVIYHWSKWQEKNADIHPVMCKWMFGPTSPWRSLWMDWPNEYEVKVGNKTVDVMSTEFNREHGIIVLSTECPGNLFASLFTGSRLCFEFPNHARNWFNLVNNGIDPAVAWFFAMLLHTNCGGNHFISPHNANHAVMDAETVTEQMVRAFIRGETQQLLPNWNEEQTYRNVFDLWRTKGETSNAHTYDKKHGYLAYLIKEYAKGEPDHVAKRSWGQEYVVTGAKSWTRPFIEIVQHEQERLLK